tara:strand:- start:1507 stop:2496 length:990 start_codon:yes stop_codon:yes gene_type:complete
MSSNITIGQRIRRIRANKISLVYSLFGGEPFLEEFIISELKKVYLGNKGQRLCFSLDQDPIENLFVELSSNSLFEDKRIITVREIKKIRSEINKRELIKYIKSPNENVLLIIICEDFDLKSSFLKGLSRITEFIDCRPPFENEMKKWVKYILNNKKIIIEESILEEYIHLYGDSIAHIISEINKISIRLGEGTEINKINYSSIEESDRLYHLWHLQDCLGMKDFSKSLIILDSLLSHGTKITSIIIALVYLYQQLLWLMMGKENKNGFTGLNKIITLRLKKYKNNYSLSELTKLLSDLRNIDILSKSTSINQNELLYPMMLKICKNEYV